MKVITYGKQTNDKSSSRAVGLTLQSVNNNNKNNNDNESSNKFRSQTSNNMDRWKSRGGKSQRREEKRKEERRSEKIREEKESEERVRRKKMQVREKIEKVESRDSLRFSNDLWLQRVEKLGSLKRRARSHLAGWQMKNREIARRCGAKHIWKRKK